MKCTRATELMSAYYDQELPSELRSEMSRHLETCGSCSQQLVGFRHLSQLASQLADPTPPAELWDRIRCHLPSSANGSPIQIVARTLVPVRTAWTRRPSVRLATAATVLLAITGLFLMARVGLHNAEERRVAADFDAYLTRFDQDPDAAQRILTENYDGHNVTLGQAVTLVRYQPAASNVPKGYSLYEMNILKMPCCTCVHAIWKRLDGGYLAVFEHDREQTLWFGDRPTISARCNGARVRIVQVEEMVAATWESGPRQLTLIGARDLDELLRLVSHFNEMT